MAGEPYAGNLHVRFDEGGGGPAWPHSYSTKSGMICDSSIPFANGRRRPYGYGPKIISEASLRSSRVAGKPFFAEVCMQLAASGITDLHFIILVPTVALLDQWFISLQEELDIDPEDIGSTGKCMGMFIDLSS